MTPDQQLIEELAELLRDLIEYGEDFPEGTREFWEAFEKSRAALAKLEPCERCGGEEIVPLPKRTASGACFPFLVPCPNCKPGSER